MDKKGQTTSIVIALISVSILLTASGCAPELRTSRSLELNTPNTAFIAYANPFYIFTSGDSVAINPNAYNGTLTISPALSNGLSMDDTGKISGTATGTLSSTTYTVTATDESAHTKTTVFSLQITGPFVLTDQDDTATGFGGGTPTAVSWVSTALQLSNVGTTNTGEFVSRVFDASYPASWTSIAWVPKSPSYKPLITSSETTYTSGDFNATGLKLLMHFDESSWAAPNSVIDSSGNGMNGTEFGDTTPPTVGYFGNAADFDGTNYIKVPTTETGPLQTLNGTVTAMAWINEAVSQPGNDPTFMSLLASNQGNGFTLEHEIFSNKGFCSFNDNYNTCAPEITPTTPDGLNDGNWHHLAVVYDLAHTTITLYVDGQSVATDTGYTSAIGNVTTAPVALGAGCDDSTCTNNYSGSMDEFAIFSRALTAAEVLAAYQRGAQRLQFQVRSCAQASCSDGTFVGPDGTAATYFSETAQAGLPSFALTGVPSNRYFQYKTNFQSTDKTYTPDLLSVSVGGRY